LRDSGVGCHFGDVFIVALAYADDISLLSPSPCGMRKLLAICEKYATELRTTFSAAESKCLFTTPSKYRPSRFSPNSEFYIGGYRMEYTDRRSRLGHITADNADDREDILLQRNKQCGHINDVL
jgi:hypothetical protein